MKEVGKKIIIFNKVIKLRVGYYTKLNVTGHIDI